MPLLDYVALVNDFVAAVVVSIGLCIPFYFTVRYICMQLLSTPQVNAIARAAAMFAGKGGAAGDWKGKLVSGGFKFLERLLG